MAKHKGVKVKAKAKVKPKRKAHNTLIEKGVIVRTEIKKK